MMMMMILDLTLNVCVFAKLEDITNPEDRNLNPQRFGNQTVVL